MIGWHEFTGTLYDLLVTPLDWRVAGGIGCALLILATLAGRNRVRRYGLLLLAVAFGGVVALQHNDAIPGMDRVAEAVGWPERQGWSEVPRLLDDFADRQEEAIRAMRALEARSGGPAPGAFPESGSDGADDSPTIAE